MRYWKLKIENRKFRQGYAALTAILLIIFSSLTIIGGLTFFSFQEAGVNRAYARSVIARAVAEAGIEDATYRILAGKQIDSSETLVVGSDSTTISVATVGNQRTVRSAGIRTNVQQNLETRVEVTTDAIDFHYGVQVGDGGIIMNNGAQVNGNVYSNGNISGGTVTGDATVAGGITTYPQLQWATNNADQFFATSTASRDIAQSFTAPAAGLLNRVSVFLGKVGTPGSNLTLRITKDSAGKPDRNGEIANAIIVPAQVSTTPGWIDVPLATPPTLTNATEYWIVLDDTTNSTTDYWNWRKDSTDGYTDGTGKYADDWNSASAHWINAGGDLSFRVWVGGVNTQIANATIGGQGRANLFVNVIAGGSPCPNVNCIVENPAHQNMPISDSVIQGWKNEAVSSPGHICGIADGCDVSGNLTISGTKSIGPLKIPGNLTFSNGAHLTVAGTVWVAGNVDFANNCVVSLDSGYKTSGVVLVDGTVNIANNCTFNGAGVPGSYLYLMILDDKNDPTHQVMDISNNSTGVIYYAQTGRIHFNNNAGAKEVTAYGIDMDNNVTVTYESGLASVAFSSGPSGGYAIEYWKQVP